MKSIQSFPRIFKYLQFEDYYTSIVSKSKFISNFCRAATREEKDKFKHRPGELQPFRSRMRPRVYCRVVFAPRLLAIGRFKRGVFSQLRPRGGGGAEPVLPRSLLAEFNAGSGSKCPVQASLFSGNSRNIVNYFRNP